MTDNEIDWSKAPEDAQYYYNHLWYKIEGGEVWIASDNGYWLSSADWSIDDNLDNNPKFIKRPVEAVSIKPHLGLTPKNIWEEQMQYQRRQDIHAAMQRYIEAGKEIPNDWLYELISLNNMFQNVQPEIATEAVQGGWIKWGKNEKPNISADAILELEYVDGDLRKGSVEDWTWNEDNDKIENHTVARYRVLYSGDEE